MYKPVSVHSFARRDSHQVEQKLKSSSSNILIFLADGLSGDSDVHGVVILKV